MASSSGDQRLWVRVLKGCDEAVLLLESSLMEHVEIHESRNAYEYNLASVQLKAAAFTTHIWPVCLSLPSKISSTHINPEACNLNLPVLSGECGSIIPRLTCITYSLVPY